MAAKDPTEAIRLAAAGYAGVDEGTACTQASFKAGGKAFLFIGEQGGRYKAMFKLSKSLPEAERLAAKTPDDYQLGSWFTARFSAEKPMPKTRWTKWLAESYELATSKPVKKTAGKKAVVKKKVAKKATKKKAVRKKA